MWASSLRRPGQRPLFWLGVLLLASGLGHVGVWLVQGGSLEGPVSWRKPIVFGLSAGMATLSFAWVHGLLRPRAASRALAWGYCVSMFVEIALIDMQQWRGVASHFNQATPFDAAVFSTMGTLILAVAIIVAIWTYWSFDGLRTDAAMGMAIRAGMLFFDVGTLLGLVIVLNGEVHKGTSHPPNVFGHAGVLKVPHGIAFHALQLLPLLAWSMARRGRPIAERLHRVRLGTIAYAGLLAATMVQTFSGRAPTDLTITTAPLLLAAAACLVAAVSPVVAGADGAGAY
jgi:hypothetical protein